MAWSTPPTFSDGATLSATQLNVLSDDLSYLYALLQAPVAPFQVVNLNTNYEANGWYIRYRERYLHYKITVDTGATHEALTIEVNGTSVFSDNTTRSAGYTYQGYADLNSLSLTTGNLYLLQLSNTFPGSNSGITVHWFRLSGSTTL